MMGWRTTDGLARTAMMPLMTDDRQRLRATFDAAAQLYQQARPEYPPELYGELVRLAALQPRDRLHHRPAVAKKDRHLKVDPTWLR